ncbi:cytidine deaminase 1-like [Capsicum galapagoense]
MDQLKLKFVVEASEAESISQKLGLPSVRHLLPVLVEPAQSLARPPISNYHVGAVGLGSDGRLFLGVNLEFPGLPLNHSVHAEQFLLTNLAVHHCPGLLAFAVSAAPCGHCRQFLQELRNPCSLQIHITSQHHQNDVTFEPLREILPNPFGPFDLLDDETPLLLERHNNGLSLLDHDHDGGDLCNGFSDPQSKRVNGVLNSTLVKIAALEAANNSHAPYSGCPSGVAIMDCDGKIYKGSYVESAAYNPSLGPVQAALVAFVAGGGGGYERIVAAALVEKETANVRQGDTARLSLKLISPQCPLTVFHCCSFAEKNGCKKD